MSPYEIIARKRDKQKLTAREIDYFISAYLKDKVTDYQITAFLMATYLNGMDSEEISALTKAYIDSGETIDLSDVPGKKVDKHSTGGVGDKVSIVLAPLVAALGVPVPMISGRGLGHSGGTLDKLESIPGFNVNLPVSEFRRLVKTHGLGLIGQTADIVPADKRIYALRDVTATVDNIPLISASIMSKKIAEGIDGLVLDVKYGNGAFMKDPVEAEKLAHSLISIGKEFGKTVVALLTSMEQPLGNKIGNWLEIDECIDCMHGKGPADLREVTLALCSRMLLLGDAADSLEDAWQRCEQALDDGSAFAKFLKISRAQGADISYLEQPEKYPRAAKREVLKAATSGHIHSMNTFDIGMASVSLGAGRKRAEDTINPRAGIILRKKCGDAVREGEEILEIHCDDALDTTAILQRLQEAITITEHAPAQQSPLILKEIS